MAIVANGYRFEAHIVNGNAVVKCECGAIFDSIGEDLLVRIGEHVMQHLDESAGYEQEDGSSLAELPPMEEPDDVADYMDKVEKSYDV